jgi:hypothetical protein
MATKLGSTTISKLYLGVTEITKAYLGSTEVYSSGGAVVDDYAANSISPEFVADFANDYYRVASNESTFDSALTFSRSGNATMVDSDGLIKWAPHNFIDESEFANGTDPVAGGWVDASSGAYSATTFVNGLGETVGAVTATMTNSAPRHRYPLSGLDSNGTYTVEVWIGPSTTITGICLQVTGFTNISGTTTANVEDADANGRIAITFTLDTDVAGDLYIGRPFGNTTGVIEMGGVSLYRSDLGGMVDNPDRGDSYVPTTGSAAYLARRGHHVYNGTSWVNEGILVESEARTNFVTNSEDFSQSAWGNVSSTESLESVTSPANDPNVYRLDDGTISDRHVTFQQVNLTSGNTYAFSCFIKNDDRQYAQLLLVGLGGVYSAIVYFDLVNGVVTDEHVGTGYIEDFGNGWYRCTAVGTVSIQTSYANVCLSDRATHTGSLVKESPSYTGSNKGIYIWGAQLEEGSTPSSYIPTSGSTVTRAGETLEVTGTNVSAGETSYSIAIDAYIQSDGTDMGRPGLLNWFSVLGTSTDLYRHVYRGSSILVNQRLLNGNNNNVFLSIGSGSRYYKIASRASATENQTALNGTAEVTKAQTGNPVLNTAPVKLGTSGQNANQTIKSLILWDDDIGTAGIEEASS